MKTYAIGICKYLQKDAAGIYIYVSAFQSTHTALNVLAILFLQAGTKD